MLVASIQHRRLFAAQPRLMAAGIGRGVVCVTLLMFLAASGYCQGVRRPPVQENNKNQLDNKAPVKEQTSSPLSPQKLEEALRLLLDKVSKDSTQAAQRRFRPTEIQGLILDQTVSKIGHDFYDVFFTNWDPPAGLGDFTVTIREKPGRGNSTIISMQVNDTELLELPLQPKYDTIEEAAFYSLAVAVDFLVNSRNISQQLEKTADNPGNEVF